MPRSGPTYDFRPVFGIFATGHAAAIPNSMAFYHANPSKCLEVPGVKEVWEYLDVCFSRRLESHRPVVFGRADHMPIDLAVQHYALARKVPYLPEPPNVPEWGKAAKFRRDLELVARAAGVVWFGEDEETDASPPKLAAILGIEYRVMRLEGVR